MIAVIMFLNGLAVMVLEMVGARLLAPWLGTSVIVWTSLIGVILASLSVGYWLGGRLADSTLRTPHARHSSTPPRAEPLASKVKQATRTHDHIHDLTSYPEAKSLRRAHSMLAALLTAAATLVLITALVQSIVLSALSQLISSMHIAAVFAALLLFAAPGVLCGMVSPFAIRLAITRNESAGATIGRLNAISTIGSIAGTFLGGFILVSWFGSTEITLGVSACLLVAALLSIMRPAAPQMVLLALVILCGTAGRSSYFLEKDGDVTLETAYSTIRVLRGSLHNRPMRLLMTNPGSCQSGAFIDNPVDLAFDYTHYYALGTTLNPKASRVLMLGGGGYSVPKWLLHGPCGLDPATLKLDVVELDPGITQAAQQYFWTPANDPRMTVHHEDARSFLNRAAAEQAGNFGPYDLIFADIFNSWYTVPFHVGTREAAQKIHSLLRPDGIFIMNIITAVEGDNGRLLRSIHHAFAPVFGKLCIFPVQDARNGNLVQNVMIMGFRTPRDLPTVYEAAAFPQIVPMLEHQWKPALAQDVPPLTDNFAPVERYTLGFLQ